jgi:uncharacterized membrane protein YfcA
MIFFPVDLAIALTGIVHFFNNIFKLFLVGKNADKEVLLKFGIPAVIASFAGALILLHIADLKPLFSYTLSGTMIHVYPVKFIIGILLIFFAVIELIPAFEKLQFNKNKLPVGGLLSGFFGGLSGNQGALRSAFLIKAGLTKEQFIGSAVVISAFVDFTRLGVYSSGFEKIPFEENISVLTCATLAAIAGAFIGNKLLKKITLKFLQHFVAIMLIVISLGLASGLI